MKERIVILANNPKVQWGFLLFLTVFITTQRLLVPSHDEFTNYNNYIIFKQSFFHLMENKDLYISHPSVQYDLFKYSPTFALAMVVLAYFPIWLGLFLWNFLNVAVLFIGLSKLKFGIKHGLVLATLFILPELVTTTHNSQSNALIAGLILLGFHYLENKKIGNAAFLLVSTVFIKLFGLVGFVLFLFYPKKIKAGLWVVFAVVLMAVFPLLVVSYPNLINQYESWLHLLQNDHSNELKISVMGFLNAWFGVIPEFKNYILLLGVFVFCIPLIKYKSYRILKYRQLYMASVLLWVVLFNHMAESATFILAVAGVAVWFFIKVKPSTTDKILLLLCILFTLFAPSDIYPAYIRNTYFVPYAVKVIPCILIWIKINFELWTVDEKIKISA